MPKSSQKERLKSPRHRLFFALDLPDGVVRELVRWQHAELAALQGLRVVPPQSLHCTLVFLGYQPVKMTERIAAIGLADLPEIAGFRLALGQPALKPERRPRVLACELNDLDGALIAFQGAMTERLLGARLHKPETRPFWPHVTLGRFKRRVGADRAAGAAKAPLPKLSGALQKPFHGVRLTLYRSILKPQGASYDALAEHRFGGGDRSKAALAVERE